MGCLYWLLRAGTLRGEAFVARWRTPLLLGFVFSLLAGLVLVGIWYLASGPSLPESVGLLALNLPLVMAFILYPPVR